MPKKISQKRREKLESLLERNKHRKIGLEILKKQLTHELEAIEKFGYDSFTGDTLTTFMRDKKSGNLKRQLSVLGSRFLALEKLEESHNLILNSIIEELDEVTKRKKKPKKSTPSPTPQT